MTSSSYVQLQEGLGRRLIRSYTAENVQSRIAVGFTTIAEHSMNIGVELLAKGISSLSELLY